ncbi:hypothetical protein [Bacteroides pyogenes]|uniref:hypothetical protein n=1 Tax=Bacteroides pyogenes TaxID=310300 RepID=UPI001BAAC9BC|nr:hypothetical protein [Bacteroides pyogenes]MBR8704743.1 hypothetical protein [Bacteroides pyogenes]
MKVTYIVKSELNFYPPCVTQIRLLKEFGVDVDVIFGSCSNNVLQIFKHEGIPFKQIGDTRGVFKGRLDKLNNWLSFRRNLLKELKKRNNNDTLLWFGNAETLLPMKWALLHYKYAVTFLELLDNKKFRMFLLKDMAKKAEFVVSCEETRSYIMKAWWKLTSLPYTMPNKPYDDPNVLKELTDEKAISLLHQIGNKKIIIYQGIVKELGILTQFAKAVNEVPDDFILLIMGPDPENLVPKLKEITSKVLYSEYIASPNHLQVTGRARIGIVYYNGDSNLNRAYCAPNKIYEYSAFGIPMIANNIPGLKNTVGLCGAAKCIDLISQNIVNSIEYIDRNYDELSRKSRLFYESTNIKEIMRQIIDNNHIK